MGSMAHMGPGPYGPGTIWARDHMGQGPYGPGPIWARAHMGPGPYGARARAPGPRFLGEFLTANWFDFSRGNGLIFHQILHFHENKKDAGRPYDSFAGGIAPRSLF